MGHPREKHPRQIAMVLLLLGIVGSGVAQAEPVREEASPPTSATSRLGQAGQLDPIYRTRGTRLPAAAPDSRVYIPQPTQEKTP